MGAANGNRSQKARVLLVSPARTCTTIRLVWTIFSHRCHVVEPAKSDAVAKDTASSDAGRTILSGAAGGSLHHSRTQRAAAGARAGRTRSGSRCGSQSGSGGSLSALRRGEVGRRIVVRELRSGRASSGRTVATQLGIDVADEPGAGLVAGALGGGDGCEAEPHFGAGRRVSAAGSGAAGFCRRKFSVLADRKTEGERNRCAGRTRRDPRSRIR